MHRFAILFFLISTNFVNSDENFEEKFRGLSKPDDCVKAADWEKIFGHRLPYHTDASHNVFCYRDRDGTPRMSSTSRDFEDPRFMCAAGPMQWYRGRRNVDFLRRPCVFWAAVGNVTHADISDGSSSSYSMKRILPDEYENFCRNPDKDPLGPWCYVDSSGRRAPCFEPCLPKTDIFDGFVCLNKLGFPYSSTQHDLSDILDLPQLVRVFDVENVHLMFESRFVTPSLNTTRRSTKSCINSDEKARVFGPWIAVWNDLAKEFVKNVGRRKLRELCAPTNHDDELISVTSSVSRTTQEAISEDELTVSGCSFWRRCFSSCQDDVATCWNSEDDVPTQYFGAKKTSVTRKECVSWTEVAGDLLRNAKRKNGGGNSSIYFSLLFDDPQGFFIKSRLFLNTERSCMLLNRQTDAEKDAHWLRNSNFTRQTWNSAFAAMFQNGPGCFVKSNGTLQFEPCYAACPPGNIAKSVNVTRQLCRDDEAKNGYSICRPPRSDDWMRRGRWQRKNQSSRKSMFMIPIILLISSVVMKE